MNGTTSIGVKLYQSGKRVLDCQSFPDLMGDTDKIETTCLEDTSRRYLPGLKDPGDMEFEFLYSGQGEGTNWKMLRDAEIAGTAVEYELVFPDKSSFKWSGIPSVGMAGKGIGEAITFKAKITPTTEITPVATTTTTEA